MTSPVEHSHLLIIDDEKGRREFELNQPMYRLGRDPKCDIRLSSQFVSRLHATLIQLPQPDGSFFYRILDGGVDGKPSSNGILINGSKVQAGDLKNSDEIVFGPKISAVYYVLRPTSKRNSTLPDEFDITLISPNMMDDGDPSAEVTTVSTSLDIPELMDESYYASIPELMADMSFAPQPHRFHYPDSDEDDDMKTQRF